ncbi:MAG TPA: hypothetical protein VFY92_03025 [Hyphomicrobiaceae bacterium]|nr:hypothetical protein [Hyphomicrobiaceae bacterium]
MHKSIWAMPAALVIALGLFTAPVEAGPAIGSAAAGLKGIQTETRAAEQVRSVRRCWRGRSGRLHCRRAWIGPRFYGPGVSLYFGGRRHHFRGHGFRGRHFHGSRSFRAPRMSHGFRDGHFRGGQRGHMGRR